MDFQYRRAVISDMLKRNAMRTPNKIAVVERKSDGKRREVSYQDLNQLANLIAAEWQLLGVKPKSTVAGIGKNGIELIAAYFATLKLGCVFTMLNYSHTRSELEYQISHAKPEILAYLDSTSDLVDSLQNSLTESNGCSYGLDKLLNKLVDATYLEPDVEIADDWSALLVYTSGTESRPKGVELTHRNFMIATTPAWSYEGYLRNSDRFLLLAPIHTMAGIGTVTNAISLGATLVVLDSTDPNLVLEAIEVERISNMSQTPTFYRRMVESDKFSLTDLTSLEQCHTYGGLNQVGVFEALVTKVPHLQWATYWGQSELSQLGCIGWFKSLSEIPGGDLRWIGLPVPHLEVRVVDESDNDAEVGEMIIRSPAIMSGYRNDEEKTKEVLRGGWLRTGDIVRQDAEKNLFFYDRKKDVIKTGGMNVSSLEVEQAILEIPGVLEVAVVGVSDEVWSEAVVAFVVIKSNDKIDSVKIISHCKSNLAGYKVPKVVHFKDSLPKDLQGKILKRILRDELNVS
jgi:acyl-CoA synthetase (AMP-forming)/AMP-acid ligase II